MTHVTKAMLLKQLPVGTLVNLDVEHSSQYLEGLRIHINSRTRLGFENLQKSYSWTLNKDAHLFSWNGSQLLIYSSRELPALNGGTYNPLRYRLEFPEFINWYSQKRKPKYTVLPDV